MRGGIWGESDSGRKTNGGGGGDESDLWRVTPERPDALGKPLLLPRLPALATLPLPMLEAKDD